MKKQFKRISLMVFFLAMLLPVPMLFADVGANGKIFPPNSKPHGRTYSEWMAAWQQWAISIPASEHPLFDAGPADTGQAGPVFFLGGKFCRYDQPACGANNVVRHITVPPGKSLFFPIMDVEISTVETGGGDVNSPNAVKDVNVLRQLAEQYTTNCDTNLSLEIDGISVPNLTQDFRFQSPLFGFYLPPDDIFTAVGEGTFTPGYYYPGVDDGYYVMLHPLSADRQHTIHFHGETTPQCGNWVLDVTYFLQVQK